MDTAAAAGDLTDPARARLTLTYWAERWLATLTGTEATRSKYQQTVARILQQWGTTPVRAITRTDIRAWIAHLHRNPIPRRRGPARPLSANTVRGIHAVLRQILQLAVDEQAIPKNPADGVPLPTVPRAEPKALPVDALTAVVAALDEVRRADGTFALVLATGGFRWSEAARAEVRHLVGPGILVEHAWSTVSGRRLDGDGKTHRQRFVPLPPSTLARVRELADGRPADAPLFPAPRGRFWHWGSWDRVWHDATLRAGLRAPDERGPTTHGLRHFAATMAISVGADVKVLQHLLGQESAKLTLDTYGHLLAGRLDEVAAALDPIAAAVGGPANGPTTAQRPADPGQ